MLSINNENRRWWILIAVGLGGGLILLDETVLGVALPSLRRDFGMSQTTSHWVINAYFLAFGGFAAAGGKLADLVGLRRAMVGSPLISSVVGRMGDKYGVRGPALAGMTVVSLSLLWIASLVDAGRYGLLVPGLFIWGFTLPFCFVPAGHAVMKAVPPDKQGQAGGIIATVRLLGGTFGMAVSGTVLTLSGSYRAVFLVTVCALAAVLLFGFLFLERRPRLPAG